MTITELHTTLTALRSLPAETEVVEFKEAKNDFHFDKLGKYFSALSNEANLNGKNEAWLVFGIENERRNVIGTKYRAGNRPQLDKLKTEIANKTTNRITFIEIHELDLPEGRVVMFQIPAAPQGLPIAWEGHYYGRDGEDLSPLNLEEIERIRRQATRIDWSAGICPGVTLADLSTDAIEKAKTNFKIKNPRLAGEVDTWDNPTFLTKAKVMANGKLTRTAVLLLGKQEAAIHLQPAHAQITWVLYDKDKVEKDYAHFAPPYILSVDEIYSNIRNLKYRYMKSGTLFPDEVDQYDPQNIREALSNCIAHMDYTTSGRITIAEREDGYLSFTNPGSFLPGSIEEIIRSEDPPAYNRNILLAETMVSFNMIDSIGSGIKRMFRVQRDRFFPLPEYDFDNNKVKVTLIGKMLDMEYAKVLAQNADLSLEEIILLDKLQKRKPLSDAELKLLRDKGLIEGKKPNIIISANVARTTGQKAAYTKNKAFSKQQYFDWIIKGIKDHHSLSRKDIEELLWGKLSNLLDDKQKKVKINNLLSELRIRGIIENKGTFKEPKWVLINKGD